MSALEDALEAARSVVNSVETMGRTFADFGARRISEL